MPQTRTIVRLLALALTLVAAWPSAAEHPRRGYVCLGSAPVGASPDDAAQFASFVQYVALPVEEEAPVAFDGPTLPVLDIASSPPYRSRPGSSSSERGPPLSS
jgi:hypothetical protein